MRLIRNSMSSTVTNTRHYAIVFKKCMLMSLRQTSPIRKYVKAIFCNSPWKFFL